MSALLGTITVMLMQTVLTQMEALPAHVMQDTVVMESAVLVNITSFDEDKKHLG